MTSICLIFCPTGQVGRAAVEYVLRNGSFDIVRLAARQPDKVQISKEIISNNNNKETRVEVVGCDLNSEKDIHQAFTGGVTVVFLMTPDDFFDDNWLDKMRMTIQYYAAAVHATSYSLNFNSKERQLRRVVCLSTIGAKLTEAAGDLSLSGELEDAINLAVSEGCVEVVYIRPGYFFSNFRPEINEGLTTGIITTPLPAEARFPCQSPQDIGNRVGTALVENISSFSITNNNNNIENVKKVIQFSLPNPCGISDVARILQEITAKSIKLHTLEESIWRSALSTSGIPPRRVQSLIEMSNSMVTGRACFNSLDGTIEAATTTLENYISDFIRTQKPNEA